MGLIIRKIIVFCSFFSVGILQANQELVFQLGDALSYGTPLGKPSGGVMSPTPLEAKNLARVTITDDNIKELKAGGFILCGYAELFDLSTSRFLSYEESQAIKDDRDSYPVLVDLRHSFFLSYKRTLGSFKIVFSSSIRKIFHSTEHGVGGRMGAGGLRSSSYTNDLARTLSFSVYELPSVKYLKNEPLLGAYVEASEDFIVSQAKNFVAAEIVFKEILSSGPDEVFDYINVNFLKHGYQDIQQAAVEEISHDEVMSTIFYKRYKKPTCHLIKNTAKTE